VRATPREACPRRRRRRTPSPGWPRLKLGDDNRDPLVSDRERRGAGRAVLGQMLSWALKLRGGHGGLAEGMRGDRQTLRTWALTAFGPKRGRRRNFLFIFRKHFREKQNNLEIAR
jgi:hypothetical protein